MSHARRVCWKPRSGRGRATRSGQRLGLAGWAVWPLNEFVARHGMRRTRARAGRAARDDAALHRRVGDPPVHQRHPALTFATLARWGTRSERARATAGQRRQPPAPAVGRGAGKALVVDPSPTLPLLRGAAGRPERLRAAQRREPPERHRQGPPALVADWIARHLPEARRRASRPAQARRVARCIKCGDSRVLGAWGLGPALRGDATQRASPRRGRPRRHVDADGDARSQRRITAQQLAHRLRACTTSRPRRTSPKVFKGWSLDARRRRAAYARQASRAATDHDPHLLRRAACRRAAHQRAHRRRRRFQVVAVGGRQRRPAPRGESLASHIGSGT